MFVSQILKGTETSREYIRLTPSDGYAWVAASTELGRSGSAIKIGDQRFLEVKATVRV